MKKHPHPSALEAAVCDLHSAREMAKEISDLKWIATVHLTPHVKWKVDFSYTVTATGIKEWAEAKGKDTRDYVVKRNLWKDVGPGVLRIWKGTWKRPTLNQTITPESSITNNNDISTALNQKNGCDYEREENEQ